MRFPVIRLRLNSKLFIGLFVVLQILVIALAFMTGILFHDWILSGTATLPNFLSQKTDLPLLHRAQQLVAENAYDPLPSSTVMEYGMIRGMLESLKDPFTTFYDPPQAELQSNQLEGHYGGIGVRLDRDSQGWVYLYPLPDSTALKAGIKDGDRLLQIGSKTISPQTSTDDIQASIRGKVGEKVNITIGRLPDYNQPLVFAIQRAEVALPSTTWNLAPNEPTVGVIQVHVMADPTPGEITNAIHDLQSHGAKVFVIDLRDNGGGFVDSGVNSAKLFLKSGPIIAEQYHNQPVKTYMVDKPGPFSDLPVVFLVNKGTASAAEMFAGALQGQKRAKLVGSATYGKDSIQLVFDLGDGSSIHITSARWWVPGLEPPIKGNGLQPDVNVPDDGTVPPLQKAIELLKTR